eukprot:scaffold98358_cov57-Phaeocystis_antarctica.AAC.3
MEEEHKRNARCGLRRPAALPQLTLPSTTSAGHFTMGLLAIRRENDRDSSCERTRAQAKKPLRVAPMPDGIRPNTCRACRICTLSMCLGLVVACPSAACPPAGGRRGPDTGP